MEFLSHRVDIVCFFVRNCQTFFRVGIAFIVLIIYQSSGGFTSSAIFKDKNLVVSVFIILDILMGIYLLF